MDRRKYRILKFYSIILFICIAFSCSINYLSNIKENEALKSKTLIGRSKIAVQEIEKITPWYNEFNKNLESTNQPEEYEIEPEADIEWKWNLEDSINKEEIRNKIKNHYRQSKYAYTKLNIDYLQKIAHEKNQWGSLVKETKKNVEKPKWCTPLKFMDPPMQYPIALVSFPGSGNTWLRYLLQQATGIYTGSVYNDTNLLNNGFLGEMITNGSVLVVKTHEIEIREDYKKAVLIIRDPGDAILAEFNRKNSDHTGLASEYKYKGRPWYDFVYNQMTVWRQTYMNWILYFQQPIHVITYDALVEDTKNTLWELLQFLEVEIDESLLQCALERRQGSFRREKDKLKFNPFDQEMRKQLDVEKKYIYKIIDFFMS